MKKLVLFDIDGTLVSSTASGVGHWKDRIRRSFEQAFENSIPFELNPSDYNGMVDKQTFWIIAQRIGISQSTFLKKLPNVRAVYHKKLKKAVSEGNITYQSITKAVELVKRLKKHDHITLGLLTGNVEINAWLKLKTAKIDKHFSFGVFGDTAWDRVGLVHEIIPKAQKHFKEKFTPDQIIIIGDTHHDIRAGKAIGAQTIGVASGFSHTKIDLAKEDPTLAVDSLMDPKVLDFFQIEKA